MAFGKHKQNALAKERMVAEQNAAEQQRRQAAAAAQQQAAIARQNAAIASKEQQQNSKILEQLSDRPPATEYINDRNQNRRGSRGRSAFGLSRTRGLGGSRSTLG